RSPAPPGRRTQHHVRQPTIRSRAPSLPAGLRSELKEEASAQGGGRGTFAEQACRWRRGPSDRPSASGVPPPQAPDATPRPTADDPEPCPVAAGRPAQRTQGGGLRPGRRPGTFAEQACRLRRGRPDATGPPKSRALCPRPSTQGNTRRNGRTSTRSYTPASTYGSASAQARASSSDPNSAT